MVAPLHATCRTQEKDFTNWLGEVLHDKHPDLGLNGTDTPHAPYEIALFRWRSEAISEFKNAVIELIKNATQLPWKTEPFNELSHLVEAMEFSEAADTLLAGLAALKTKTDLPESDGLQMLVLRTLQGIKWKGTPEFWLSQRSIVGERWPGIVFFGVSMTDLPGAFKLIPDLFHTAESMNCLLALFPGLMRERGLTAGDLADLCQGIPVQSLSVEAQERMRQWFKWRQ